ncbi:hypothetical protein [Streptomyces odonnellii]|uniref:hypothetical protein n=1 Tax=Streptomyces odonnellii TaxID=1417980 RepID=UPI001E34D29A|nr:hypothetical protein [Streptomyces odonnellii]
MASQVHRTTDRRAPARGLATRPVIVRVLARWGHIALALVLIAIGLLILIEGGAFCL